MSNHTGTKLGPDRIGGMSWTAFARSVASVVILYVTYPPPEPVVSTSAKNAAMMGPFDENGNAAGVKAV